jgi:ABC-type transport system involved in multi-copper enzyme maturation permease subunit
MLAQLRCDLVKLRSTRTVLWYLAVAVALTGFALGATALTAGSGDFEPLSSLSTQDAMVTTGTVATVLAMFFGAITLSGEIRHKTIVPTLLATPSRTRVVASSASTAVVAGAAIGFVSVLVAVGGTYLVLVATGTDVSLTVGTWLAPSLGTVAASGLSALLGIGIGGILRNQALAVAAVAVLLFVLEPLTVALLPDVATWMPASVSSAVAAAGDGTDPGLAAAAAALTAYGIVAAAGATVALRRTEIH